MKALTATLILLAAACTESTVAPEEAPVSYIALATQQPVAEVPLSGRLGVPLTIKFDSYVGNTGAGVRCVHLDEIRIEESQGKVRITPIDERVDACVDTLVRLHNEVSVVPKNTGIMILEIAGRKFPTNEDVVLSHQVQISP